MNGLSCGVEASPSLARPVGGSRTRPDQQSKAAAVAPRRPFSTLFFFFFPSSVVVNPHQREDRRRRHRPHPLLRRRRRAPDRSRVSRLGSRNCAVLLQGGGSSTPPPMGKGMVVLTIALLSVITGLIGSVTSAIGFQMAQSSCEYFR